MAHPLSSITKDDHKSILEEIFIYGRIVGRKTAIEEPFTSSKSQRVSNTPRYIVMMKKRVSKNAPFVP